MLRDCGDASFGSSPPSVRGWQHITDAIEQVTRINRATSGHVIGGRSSSHSRWDDRANELQSQK